MEKQKRWQFYLILAVIVITLYNILPTIFYYSNPLRSPIEEEKAQNIGQDIMTRVNSLEEQSTAWLRSFNKLLGISPKRIAVLEQNPKLIQVTFKDEKDARKFRKFLPSAGSMISYVPAQLRLFQPTIESGDNEVYVERNIGIRFSPENYGEYFEFAKKMDKGDVSQFYKELVYERGVQTAEAIAGASPQAQQVAVVIDHPGDNRYDELALSIARDLNGIVKMFGPENSLSKRYFASFSQIDRTDRTNLIDQYLVRLDAVNAHINTQLNAIEAPASDDYSAGSLDEKKSVLLNQQKTIALAVKLIRNNLSAFKKGPMPLTSQEILAKFKESEASVNPAEMMQLVDFAGYNPFIQKLMIDWSDSYIGLNLYDDIQQVRTADTGTELQAISKEKLNESLFNEIARISRVSDEDFQPSAEDFHAKLDSLIDTKSLLALRLGKIAEANADEIRESIDKEWNPQHQDLVADVFPLRGYRQFANESGEEQKLGLVIWAPTAEKNDSLPQGMRMNSIYVIARGLGTIVDKYQNYPESQEGRALIEDFQRLNGLLQRNGFIAYPGSSYGMDPMFQKDYIFELNDYYSDLLEATRENFYVKGSKEYAVLDFSDVEQRILTKNKIENSIQEDLQRWYEEYNTAQASINPVDLYTVPQPTKNVYVENFKLSAKKYFRGDENKILKWGLDLSGGKSVRISLRDQNNRPVTNSEDIKQAINELYTRINKMGVAERTIRAENNTILLDFPGSQSFSASELIKASAMYFHIVNEKFSPRNKEVGSTVNRFLQDVWNEAVITNRKDMESINEIAWKHLGGNFETGDVLQPRSETAKILFENGLRLVDPKTPISNQFNDSISAVAKFPDEDPSEWHGQSHPLTLIFRNYALEGANIENVHVGYDPNHGNILLFNVKKSYEGSKERVSGNPRDDFYTWTSHFAREKIGGTAKEAYAVPGRGWAMAVILNGRIVSIPTLEGALRDQATIQGKFTQREINKLAADLKAGSLSFTPKILSEQNISPELGKEERTRGIIASIIALTLVAGAMIGYYRFAGLVATCAVLFNLLVMWGILQSVGVALTLPGIAGVVLTIGMAVDANVLVFERIREEFNVTRRIASAIQAGYRKAFSAIIDSNITTIMAALILIQFDSGPIKGFAVMLIIGILSSMFTSLFMTRYFFAGWVQSPERKELKMSQLIGNTKFQFLKAAPKVITISLIVMLIGGYIFVDQRNTILGMDFTGGYSLTADLNEKGDVNYRQQATDALLSAGASRGDVQVRALSRPNQLRIQLGVSMEEPGHPFYQMPEEVQPDNYTYEYQTNPRLDWVVNALAEKGLDVQEFELHSLQNNWSRISGQLSEAMRNNAIYALSLALIGILLYITFRFEFKYAVGAVVALAHDLMITLGIMAIFHQLGFPVQLDLQVIGALMTIIGYSLNDTIIVFDRIREEVQILRKLAFREVIDHALNVTLSRTLITSGTTLLVLLALVFFGGPEIFGFSLVMTIGVLVGTISSLFVACPIMLYFHKREIEKEAEARP